MKFIVSIFMFSGMLLAYSEEGCVCYASGYAYSYDTKKYFYTDLMSYRYDYAGCTTHHDSHAVNEWHDYFRSRVKDSFRYTVDVHGGCFSADSAGKLKKSTDEYAREGMSKFRNKDFSIRKLWDFSFSDH